MQKVTFHFPHPFYPNPGVNDAHCELTINKWVVMATESPTNESISITNAAEFLAQQVCEQLSIDPNRLVWIEHYPAESVREKDTFDLVQFTRRGDKFALPRWTPMGHEAAEALLASPDALNRREED